MTGARFAAVWIGDGLYVLRGVGHELAHRHLGGVLHESRVVDRSHVLEVVVGGPMSTLTDMV